MLPGAGRRAGAPRRFLRRGARRRSAGRGPVPQRNGGVPDMNSKLWWYVARAGGLMAWWTVSASVLFGLALSTRVLQRRSSPSWLLSVHRFLGGLSVTFTAI